MVETRIKPYHEQVAEDQRAKSSVEPSGATRPSACLSIAAAILHLVALPHQSEVDLPSRLVASMSPARRANRGFAAILSRTSASTLNNAVRPGGVSVTTNAILSRSFSSAPQAAAKPLSRSPSPNASTAKSSAAIPSPSIAAWTSARPSRRRRARPRPPPPHRHRRSRPALHRRRLQPPGPRRPARNRRARQ